MLDGPGKYELVAIVSHIGSNIACGHYVAHVKKDSLWYIFNDEKVALSEKLPIGHGYMYLYRCARFRFLDALLVDLSSRNSPLQ